MKILVAGGAGFIGSNLCSNLLEAGHEVVCLDNLATGRLVNIDSLHESPRFTFVEHDIVEAFPDLPRCDRIYNLASPASPPGYQRHPIETLRTNAEGGRRLLELAAAWRARYVVASTSEVYGDPLEHPQRESYRGNVSSIGPRSMYDEAKRYGEALTMAYINARSVDARIVRIFNTYGPNSDPEDGRVVPNLITQAIAGRPLTIYGDGFQTRSLCYVSDLVAGLQAAIETPGTTGDVFNLGNPEEHTITEFAVLIRELAASPSELTYVDGPVGDDPQRRRPDISHARECLGWAPTVGLRDGLERTIAYFRAERLAPVGSTP
ncbi:MAG: NAD-dependent epimerase/dehydratase family protein [Dehalococcoidia bacterium]